MTNTVKMPDAVKMLREALEAVIGTAQVSSRWNALYHDAGWCEACGMSATKDVDGNLLGKLEHRADCPVGKARAALAATAQAPEPEQQEAAAPVAQVEDWPDDIHPLAIVPLVDLKTLPVGTKLYTSPPPAQQEAAGADWRELCRRLYVELFHCDQQMMSATDEEGDPLWTQGSTVRDVLRDAKAALESSASLASPAPQTWTAEQLEQVQRDAAMIRSKIRPAPMADAPQGTAQEAVTELRLCESRYLMLKPDQLYRFTVDKSCPACQEAADHIAEAGEMVAAPSVPSDEELPALWSNSDLFGGATDCDAPAALASPAPRETEEVSDKLLDTIMEQAQVFASAWSLVGTRYDRGNAMQEAEAEKASLRKFIADVLLARSRTTTPEGEITDDQCIELSEQLQRALFSRHIAEVKEIAERMNEGPFRNGMETAIEELETRLALMPEQTDQILSAAAPSADKEGS